MDLSLPVLRRHGLLVKLLGWRCSVAVDSSYGLGCRSPFDLESISIRLLTRL
jgi:hypothetical protein